MSETTKKTFQNIRGTFDVLPGGSDAGETRIPGSPAWRFVEDLVQEVLERYHFEEIRTPILEPTELIARGVGELTDIVTKEMFAFERGDTHYVLRPEITAPVMRAYLQHHLDQRGGVQKLYYVGPCFRAEKPQKGRYRQFHQFGVEIMGAADPRADVETILSQLDVYRELGLEDLDLRINTLGGPDARDAYRAALRSYLEPYADELSEASRRRLEENPLRILDTKLEHEQDILADAPELIDYVSEESRAHYETVLGTLGDMDVAYTEDRSLVRGLDYYTETAFEIDSPHLGAQSALGGGGRYDLLAEELGSEEPVPSVGFAAGFERLFLALREEGIELPGAPAAEVFLVALGEDARDWVVRRARALRAKGLRVHYDLGSRSMKAQMREADRQDADYTVIVGDRELEEGAATLKEMASGDQTDVPFDRLPETLSERVR